MIIINTIIMCIFVFCFYFICVGPLSIGEVGLENLSSYTDQTMRSTASKVRFQPWQKLRFISRQEMGPT